jgi:hypothetical protein
MTFKEVLEPLIMDGGEDRGRKPLPLIYAD